MAYDFHTSSKHTARKPHKCAGGCRQPIVAGESYYRIAGSFEGDFYAAKMHVDCYDLRAALYWEFAPEGEGMPFSIYEAFSDAGLREREVAGMLAPVRGLYPRAVCRLELQMRDWWGGAA